MSFLRGSLRDRFGGVFGSILEVFWTDFRTKFSVILEAFFSKNAVLPAWALNFHGFLFFCVFCVFGATLEIAVLHTWELKFGEVDLQFYVFL